MCKALDSLIETENKIWKIKNEKGKLRKYIFSLYDCIVINLKPKLNGYLCRKLNCPN